MTATRTIFALSAEDYLKQTPKVRAFAESKQMVWGVTDGGCNISESISIFEDLASFVIMDDAGFYDVLDSIQKGIAGRIYTRYQYEKLLSLLEWEAIFLAAQRFIAKGCSERTYLLEFGSDCSD